MYEYIIKDVLKVIDGDTVDLLFDLGFNVFHKERIRLAGIDTPESNSKDLQERILAEDAKTFLSVWLVNQNQLKIKTTKDDKYGRMLGEIYGDNNICINKLLIDNGYAWEYNGDAKNKDFKLLLEKRKSHEN
jgi:micrococcal nuclease